MSFTFNVDVSFIYHCQNFTGLDCIMSNTASVLQEAGTAYPSQAPEFTPGFFLCVCVLSSILWCPLRFPHKHDVRFVFASSCLWEGACLVCVVFICFRVVVSGTCCVVFLFCFSSSCLPYVASFSGLSYLIAPSVFSNV